MNKKNLAVAIVSAYALFTGAANAHSSHIENRGNMSCPAGQTLVRDSYSPSFIHGFAPGDTIVNNKMWANFSFNKAQAQGMSKLYVQVLFSSPTQYDQHNFYVVPQGSNISNIYWRLNAAGFDYTQFNLTGSPYVDEIKRTGKVTIGLSHIDPNNQFKEYVYFEKVTMGFCTSTY